MSFKRTPQHEVGDLVIAQNIELSKQYQMIIRSRRWMCPNGHNSKRWVYDGDILAVNGNEIKVTSFISTVSEVNIRSCK